MQHIERFKLGYKDLDTTDILRATCSYHLAVSVVMWDETPGALSYEIKRGAYYVGKYGEDAPRYKNMIGLPYGVVERQDGCPDGKCMCGILHAAVRIVKEQAGLSVTPDNLRVMFLDLGFPRVENWYIAADIRGMKVQAPLLQIRAMGSTWFKRYMINVSHAPDAETTIDYWMVPEVRLLESRVAKIKSAPNNLDHEKGNIMPIFQKPAFSWDVFQLVSDAGVDYMPSGETRLPLSNYRGRILRNSPDRALRGGEETSNIFLNNHQELLGQFIDPLFIGKAPQSGIAYHVLPMNERLEEEDGRFTFHHI